MPPGRCRRLAVPQKALLHNPKLVGIVPRPPACGIRGRQDFYLGSELVVGHKVGRITGVGIPSDGPRRRDTLGVVDSQDPQPMTARNVDLDRAGNGRRARR